MALRVKGCAIVEALASPALVASINDEFKPFVEAENEGADNHNLLNERRTRRLPGALRFSPSARQLAQCPLVTETLRALFLPYSQDVRLHMALHRRVLPGAAAQLLHRDTHSVPLMSLRPGPGEPGHLRHTILVRSSYRRTPEWGDAQESARGVRDGALRQRADRQSTLSHFCRAGRHSPFRSQPRWC